MQESAQAVYVGHDTHQRTMINDRQTANLVLQEHSRSVSHGHSRADPHHVCGHARLEWGCLQLVGDLAARQRCGWGRQGLPDITVGYHTNKAFSRYDWYMPDVVVAQ
jgi:hypothetical protein